MCQTSFESVPSVYVTCDSNLRLAVLEEQSATLAHLKFGGLCRTETSFCTATATVLVLMKWMLPPCQCDMWMKSQIASHFHMGQESSV